VSARKDVRALATLVGLLALGLVAGCGPTMRDIPLPGTGVSGDTITVEVQFDEALNLAQGAAVKVNGVDSGKVQSVSAKDFKAVAVMKVKTSAQMRTTATARLRYTTPLGELFVDVANPGEGPLLRDGGELAPKQASTAPTVEDALSSASLLVNGGGLNQLQTVTDELNQAVGGREGSVRELLARANTFLGEANATTGDIDRALVALAAVSKILKDNRGTIQSALTDIRPAARVLRENTPGFTQLLEKLVEFSGAANTVVGKTRAQILQMIREVSPVLDQFLNLRAQFGPSLTDLVSLGKVVSNAVPGDYLNLRLELSLPEIGLPNILGPGGSGSTGTSGAGTGGLLGGLLGTGGQNPVGSLLGGLLGTTSPKAPASQPAGSSPLSLSSLLGGGR